MRVTLPCGSLFGALVLVGASGGCAPAAQSPAPTVAATPVASVARAEPATETAPTPTTQPAVAPFPSRRAAPTPAPVSGRRSFATAFSAALALRQEAWLLLGAMFASRPPAGLVTAHERASQRFLGAVLLLDAPGFAQPVLRTLLERAEKDVAAQRTARALLESYWLSGRDEELVAARQAQAGADEAYQVALRIAQAMGAELP